MSAADIILGINPVGIVLPETDTWNTFEQESSGEGDTQDSSTEPSPLCKSASFLDEVRRVVSELLCIDTPQSNKNRNTPESEAGDTNEEDRKAALSVSRPESRIGQSCWIDAMINEGFELPSLETEHQKEHESIAGILGRKDCQRCRVHVSDEVHVSKGLALAEESVDHGMSDIITQA